MLLSYQDLDFERVQKEKLEAEKKKTEAEGELKYFSWVYFVYTLTQSAYIGAS